MARPILNLIAEIGAQEGLTPAQIAAMQATAKVESGFDPNIRGDNGTSYGLFQHHVGGAGGTTHASAQRYLNPRVSITERAREFKRLNIRGGRGAAALQRPADPKGYAVKVDNALRQLGAGSLGQSSTSQSTSPAKSGTAGAGGTPSTSSFGKSYLKSYLGWDEDPVRAALWDSFYKDESPPSSTESSGQAAVPGERGHQDTASVPAGGRASGRLRSYEDILALGRSWGLRLDAGNAQTTGGSHTAGSKHYQSKAVDFGDAKNDPAKLKAFARYLSRNAGSLGINDIWYTPLGYSVDNGKRTSSFIDGHNDHLHVDVF